MSSYINAKGGYLQDSNATTDCSFCTTAETNKFLASVESHYSQRWRNFGFMWAYIAFNVAAALALYWLVRVPKKKKAKAEEKPVSVAQAEETPAPVADKEE